MLSRAAIWGVWVAIWAAIGGLLTLELYLSLAAIEPEVSLSQVAFGQFMRVLLWCALTPAVFWLRRHFPIRRRTWHWAIPLHAIFSVAAMALIYVARLFVGLAMERDALDDFWRRAMADFYGRNLIDIAIYFIVYGVAFTLGVVREFREAQIRSTNLEKDLALAEIKALKAQLHPHFLFNTLNTISVLVREGQNAEAVSLLAKLSALLRLALETNGSQEATLHHELDFLRRYLEIQQVRFSDRLEFKLDIEPAAIDALLPHLLLQPLVENAVLHGFAPKAERGCVEVAAQVRFNQLHLVVRDDGPGFPAPEHLREGIGLANTRDRLQRMFGAAARMTLCNRPAGGAEVSIAMPFRLSPTPPMPAAMALPLP